MIAEDITQLVLFVALLVAAVKPLGLYMSAIYSGRARLGSWRIQDTEFKLYRRLGLDPTSEMTWRQYAAALLTFSVLSIIVVYAVQRMQGWLPLNPQSMGAVTRDSSFNTAVSFATNTNWQGYGGESTMSYFTQMLALTVQNFVSAAVGMAVLVALIRGFVGKQATTIGNFWVDLNRGVLFILLPMSLALALLLVSQGVVQTFSSYPTAQLTEKLSDAEGKAVETQTLAVGPAASQIAIKQLGTNGGGFFNVNSAHPFENSTPLSNLLQVLAILVIPAALCYTFGDMVGDRRQGWTLLIAMLIIFVPLLGLTYFTEIKPATVLHSVQVPEGTAALAGVGNLEGKETRFGVANSAIWAVATTAASNGSVNAMHDSFTPLGGLIPMWLMQLGEVVFGGAGSGLYGMLAFGIIAVFIAGLMVGRTPEYLGKKIEAFEMKMASLVVLMPCACVLVGTALAVSTTAGKATIFNPGAHGFSEVLYALSSTSNNNGSAFGGLGANTPFYNLLGAVVMLVGRYGIAVPILAIAGSLASKKTIPVSAGTLPTHTPLFVVLLVSTVILVGALSFFPALALGPIVEHLSLTGVSH